mmetsp:Transcript_34954/g.47167  ORF Transcript_34954/g.47167 Transcript_34954/m.47167 type:complete len:100 (+) Transcript_34954:467-766(+)
MLSCFIGMGIQIFIMLYATLFALTVGIITPYMRYACLIILFIAYVIGGYFAGLLTARFYKMFRGIDWFFSASMSAIIYPTFCVGIIVLVDLLDIMEKAY